MTKEFYRIVRGSDPTIDDIRSARDDGMALVDPRYLREWAEGVSVYDNLDYALQRARRNRTGLGRFVVTIVIPDDGSIEVAKTMRNRHHFTIYAGPEQMLALVRGRTVRAEGRSED